jgi:hypothetical protein
MVTMYDLKYVVQIFSEQNGVNVKHCQLSFLTLPSSGQVHGHLEKGFSKLETVSELETKQSF